MKFNSLIRRALLRNHAGAEAWAMSPEMELYTAVVTTALSPMTYEGEDKRVDRIASLVRKCEPVFVAQLAVYTRTQMQMRSVPLLLAVELAKVHSGDSLVSRMVSRIVQRADEIMELLACYQWRNPNPVAVNPRKRLARMSRQIQAGLQEAFNHFDEYQFAKYNSASRAIKLRDALFLTHPKAKSAEQQAIFDSIASDTLAVPYTWETELSALGQQHFETVAAKNAAVSAKWSELILSGRLGYMAMLRNLRNILQCTGVTAQAMEALSATIADREQVLRSRQLPIRFLSAYQQIENVNSMWTSDVLQALEVAVRHSASNIDGFDPATRVVIASDTSGSMQYNISSNSSVMLYDIGLMLSMLMRSRCRQVITGMFGDIWKEIYLPADGILQNVECLRRRQGEVGYSTNGHLVIQDLINRRIVADKVMIFTDCQLWDSHGTGNTLQSVWRNYKSTVAPKAKLYIFDLLGYGQSPLSLTERDVYLIAGWSDKIFDILAAIDRGSSALAEIRKVEV